MRHFLNNPGLAAILSAIVALGTVFLAPAWAEGFYKQSYATIPSTTFTLLGFLIAAVTILLTIRDRPFLQALQQQRPELWKQIVNEFFVTSYLIAVFGLIAMLFGWQLPSNEYFVYKQVFLFSYLALLYLTIVQMAKTIYVLHTLAKL